MRWTVNTSTLKFRVTLTVIVLVLAAASLVAFVALAAAGREMRAVVGAQQFALLSSAAAHIDADLTASRALLVSLREELAAAAVRDPAHMQAFLEAHPGLRDAFYNVLVYDADGMVVANLNDRRTVRTQNFSQRGYFQDTVRIREGVISAPFRSALSGRPVVLVTEPVFDAQGKMRYMIGAAIDLQRPRFFGQLTSLKFGRSGYLFMITGDGTIIHHPERARILRNVRAEEGAAVPATLAALGGFEGWTEGTSKAGVAALLTYKRLQQTDWIIGAVYPVEEALTPLIAMQRKALLASAGVALLAGLLGWLAIIYLLRPLGALRNHVARIQQGSIDIEVFNVERKDEFGELSRAFYRLSQQRQDAERDMAAQARTDALTGIANRRMFEEVFALAVARAARLHNWVGLAYLDIDRFKVINDSFGHAAGDAVLIEFAARLRGAVRSTDTIARLAGDEFVVLFDCMDHEAAPEALAAKIVDCMRAPFMIGGADMAVTASIGVALAKGGWSSMDALLGAADQALYEAKGRGRDTWAVRRLAAPAVV
ncbi:MAG TPA: diguanylate cyclase [Telluria sp.]|jgi:diguanylate cyclase (GGDEF)-like protein